MNNIKYIKRRILKSLNESLNDLFDDPDIFDKNDDVLDNQTAKKLFMSDLDKVLIDLIGTDKPKAWKKSKQDGLKVLTFINKSKYKQSLNTNHAYAKNVIDELTNKGFTQYVQCPYPSAYVYNRTNIILDIGKITYNNLSLYSRQNIEWLQDDVNKWFTTLNKMPQYVKYLLKENINIECVWLSDDEGIVLIRETNHPETGILSYINQYIYTYTLKLTGLKLYDEISSKEADDKIKENKTNIKKILFLSKYIKNQINKTIVKRILINKEGEPYGITAFNWETDKNHGNNNNRKYDVPSLLNVLIKKGFKFVNSLDKEDPESVYELIKNGLLIKVYKNIDLSIITSDMEFKYYGLTEKSDSYIIFEMTDYILDLFHDIFG